MQKLYTFYLFAALPFALQAQTTNDYRSRQSGTWGTAANWERFDGTSWVVAATAPTTAAGANLINVRNGHTMQVTANVVLDQLTVDVGGTINWTGGTFAIAANASGVDLTINGTFIDNRGVGTTSMTFNAGATWQMGANGTLIRTSANSSNNWQGAYEGGIANIPATSNWILRKMTAQNPSISTSGAVYPNLTIENNTVGLWNATAVNSTFQGGGSPLIKGNLDVGGSGTSTVSFYNNATGTVQVQGDMIVRTGNTYNNNGNATELRGNLTVNGSLIYDTNDARQLNFTGGNAQSISGTGTLNVFASTINKTANHVTLNRSVTMDNSLTLTQGKFITTATNLLVVASAATVTGGSNASFVDGPIRKINTSAGFTFPVGKGTNYQPLSVNASAGGSNTTFWTENFGTGSCANQNQQVASYSGANGAWTQTILSAEGATPNYFFVSPTEAGMGLGACGNGCLANGALTNQTLHVGNDPGSPAAFLFCPTGDCGAAYDAGFFDGTVITDKRAESPTIDCSPYSNIQLSFNYLENGDGINDNGQIWYFDGVAWTMLDDLTKSPVGTCGSQGLWSAYSVMLPASANNNPNVRIGFRWVNNDDGAGGDPSFAVDDVTLTEIVPSDMFTCEYFLGDPVSTFGSTKEATIETIVTNEYWILDRNAGTASKHVTLNWDAASLVTTPATSKVIRWDGAMWRDHGNGGTTGVPANDPGCLAPNATCGNMTTSTIVSGFSPFTFALPPITTPLQLLDFSAQLQLKKVHLQWLTAQELDMHHFEIEKSANAIDFEAIGEVAAQNNSAISQTYHFYDPAPWEGTNYYRLKMVNTDGSYAYSPIVSVYYKGDVSFSIYPNPTRDKVFIYAPGLSNVAVRAQLMDITGRVLESRSLEYQNDVYELSLEHLPAATYFLRLTMGEVTLVEKIVKQ